MNSMFSRLVRICQKPLVGLWVFALAVTATLLTLPQVGQSLTPNTPSKPIRTYAGDLALEARLSHRKVVRGEECYLEVEIRTPQGEGESGRQATDMVLVLDTSGSMSSKDKIDYAKEAMKRFLSELGEGDRIALVGFSSRATTYFPLETVNGNTHERLSQLIERISTGGGTNMSSGLIRAKDLLRESSVGRSRRVILLSDGQANEGISHAEGLAKIVDETTRDEAVLSTIGMGLGFNENLMMKLADRGMGHYSFMESLASLDHILTKDLLDARQVFAASSKLEVNMGKGIRLVDAGSYSLDRERERSFIKLGQLISGRTKRLSLKLRMPEEGDYEIADLALLYEKEGEQHRVALPTGSIQVAVVAPERKKEALASIDKDVFKRSYLQNTVSMQSKRVADAIRRGEKSKAESLTRELQEVNEEFVSDGIISGRDLKKLNEQVAEMESDVEESFKGSAARQAVARKRMSKKAHANFYKLGRGSSL